jgi:hypothetical protein
MGLLLIIRSFDKSAAVPIVSKLPEAKDSRQAAEHARTGPLEFKDDDRKSAGLGGWIR